VTNPVHDSSSRIARITRRVAKARAAADLGIGDGSDRYVRVGAPAPTRLDLWTVKRHVRPRLRVHPARQSGPLSRVLIMSA
jgi:hypothetical protein